MSKIEKKGYEKLKFEEGMEQLQGVLTDLEGGQLGLDESITRFKEGAALYEHLEKKLGEAEGEIKKVLEDFDGEVIEEDF